MITVRGARTNNLADVDLVLPTGQLVVFCGLSGSGKSSMAFDTIHREGQRRYLDAVVGRSTGQRPDVVAIDGLPPTIGLDQREREPERGATVASWSGLDVPLSVLFARAGVQYCPSCGRVIEPVAAGRIAEMLAKEGGARITLEAPLHLDGEGEGVLEEIAMAGFSRLRVGGEVVRLESVQRLEPGVRVVVDRVKASSEKRDRLAEAVRLAAQIADGEVVAVVGTEERWFTTRARCVHDGTVVPEPNPARFRRVPLDPAAASVRFGDVSLPELLEGPVAAIEALEVPDGLGPLADEIAHRVRGLVQLGLGALPLGRPITEVSRGEQQRIRLVRLGSSQVSGVLYVLDEPAAGLDDASAHAVVELMRGMIAAGNSVLAVDHHPVVLRAADQLVEFGPGSGSHGGQVVFQGEIDALEGTPTARALQGPPSRASEPREPNQSIAGIRIASPGVNVITGRSGAGKSRKLEELAARADEAGFERVVWSQVESIARAQRSTVATAAGAWNPVRDLLSQTREARIRGFSASMFSMNAKGGRCETCAGLGVVRTVLEPLPDVWERCPTCDGRRFIDEVLRVRWKGHSAADLLDLDVTSARRLFADIPKLARVLGPLVDVGLGHLALGRAAPTLSGGEMRRLKLARELARVAPGTLILSDAPTLGLHPVDTQRLLEAFAALAAAGHTVVLADTDPWAQVLADALIPL